jgi:hypothetical protein
MGGIYVLFNKLKVMRNSPIIELFFLRFIFLILDSVMVYVVALKKFD